MISFNQHSEPWGSIALCDPSNPPYTVARIGCYGCSIADILFDAGYSEYTPDAVFRLLIDAGGLNKDGEILSSVVEKVFPMFHYGGSGYSIVQGRSKTSGMYHYMASNSQGIVDPWVGGQGLPNWCELTGYKQNVGIDPRPASVPVKIVVQNEFSPFDRDLDPYGDVEPTTPDQEVKRMQQYLTVKGFFQDAGAQDGWYGPKTQKAVHDFQDKKGILATHTLTAYGYWHEITRGEANKDLIY